MAVSRRVMVSVTAGTSLELGERGALVRYGAQSGGAALAFMPGAHCTADRYAWLASLCRPGLTVYIFDPLLAPHSPPTGAAPMAIATVADVLAALDAIRPHHRLLFGAGHSAGAAVMLDALDPVSARRSPRDSFGDVFRPPTDVGGVVVMGCTLQSKVATLILSHRSEDRPLTRPNDAPILFLAGDHDGLATPELTQKTRARFLPPTDLVVLAGATHYGWASGEIPTDHATFDLVGGVSKMVQQAETLAAFQTWISARL